MELTDNGIHATSNVSMLGVGTGCVDDFNMEKRRPLYEQSRQILSVEPTEETPAYGIEAHADLMEFA